jgi:UDPglucose 6-dehydrogenase
MIGDRLCRAGVSGACFADFGHDVVCVDKDPAKIARLKKGEMPIFEPGLDDAGGATRAGRLSFTTDLAAGGARCRRVFIAVGTRRGAATAMPI